ncbi:unnamed protein product [Merluccius merluccius]
MSREQLAVERARRAFCTGRSKPLENRIRQLNNLRRFLVERQAEIAEASKKDLNRSEVGIQLFETLGLESEIQLVIRKLKQWAAPRPVEKNLLTLSDTLYIQPEPLGVVLVIGAWNYPWAVTMFPLIGAIAAGNAAVVKPSEVCVHTAKVMEELLPVYLDKELYPVVTGGVTETQELLRQRFDHIVYTGNSMVGRIVMEAAAKHLTPVTLELGGKSPCYIDKHCDIPVACRRVTWGKYTNCGQTCIAPDYVLCEPSIQERVIEEMKKCIQEFYTDDPKSFPDYGRIINERHFKRVLAMTEDSAVAVGGDSDQTDCYIAPTILRDVKADSKVMQEEIFGPLLPIVPVNGLGEAISFINQREKPLVIYVFSTDDKLIKRVIEETSSGAVLANDCLVHYSVSSLPFGGVGNSGMGCYHGKFSFDQLSHLRSCMVKPLKNEGLNNMRYPPHTLKKLGWARFFLLKAPDLGWMGRMAALAVLVAVAGFLLHVTLWCYESQYTCEEPCKDPGHWAVLFPNCGGLRQSPINIVTSKVHVNTALHPLDFKGHDSKINITVENLGHSVQFVLPQSVRLAGGALPGNYRALQFHLHWGAAGGAGSEHTIDGERFPMELHVVHIKEPYSSLAEAEHDMAGIALLSFLFEVLFGGAWGSITVIGVVHNIAHTLFSALKSLQHFLFTPSGSSAEIRDFKLSDIIPPAENLHSYYRYVGSMTTPGCEQAVAWTVFHKTLPVSSKQLVAISQQCRFWNGKPMMNIFRPVQPLDGRVVYWSRARTVLPNMIGACLCVLCQFCVSAWGTWGDTSFV